MTNEKSFPIKQQTYSMGTHGKAVASPGKSSAILENHFNESLVVVQRCGLLCAKLLLAHKTDVMLSPLNLLFTCLSLLSIHFS